MKRLLLVFLLYCSFAIAGQPRIVAIGDIHGDLNSFVSILQSAGMIDAKQNWSGGKAVLVQIGDALDRGDRGRQTLDLLMKLEKQAKQAGGRVYALLGNHEVMNIMHDLRYVPQNEYANFTDSQSQKKLDDAYESYKKFLTAKAQRLKQAEPEFNDNAKSEWLKTHPPGFIERAEAFGPNGTYGKWLRSHIAVLQLDHTIFVHGGIGPDAGTMTVPRLNDRIAQELQIFDRIQKTMIDRKLILPFFTLDEMLTEASQALKTNPEDETLKTLAGIANWVSVSPDGPLWFRGYAKWSDEEIKTALPPILQAQHAKHIVVGHTVQPNGSIVARENLGVILIDTGMNSAFFPGGRASALEIQGEKLTAIYGAEKMPLTP
jgi:calcineurin-like phosphoesterase family protein